MAKRNEKGFEERRQQIIDGALHVFASKGFEQATNKDIAEAAGIGSPGRIDHYFKDKHDLFFQLMHAKVPLLQLLAQPEELLALPPRDALTRMGQTFLKVLENPEAVAVYKLMLGEAVRGSETVTQIFNQMGPMLVLRFLATYFERLMDAGVLRRTDPAVASRCFMGPLIVLLLTREVFRQPEALAMDLETFVTNAVDIFLSGMLPQE